MLGNAMETHGRRISPPAIPDGVSERVRTQLEIALAEYGVKETPGRPNRGPRVDEYVRGVSGQYGYLLGKSWCGMKARWNIDSAAAKLKIPSPLPRTPDLASGIKWIEWGEEMGLIVEQPEPGVIAVVRDPDPKSFKSHVYTVVDHLLGEDWTEEGNSGDRVDCRARESSLVTKYIRVWR